ncbi:MAG: hypothetical protein ACXWNJ_18745 [Vulcanimicrobiaceae bacterium]
MNYSELPLPWVKPEFGVGEYVDAFNQYIHFPFGNFKAKIPTN